MKDDHVNSPRKTEEAGESGNALTAAAKGLSREPVFLVGLVVVLILGVVGQIMGGSLPLVGWLLVGVYVAGAIIWALIRLGRVDDSASIVTDIRRPPESLIQDSGNIATNDRRSRQSPIQASGDVGSAIAPQSQAPDARLEDALVAFSSGLVTRGLAAARDLVLDIARRQGRGRFDVIADGGCGKTVLLRELTEGLRDFGYATLFITISPQSGGGDEPSEADRLSGDEQAYQTIIADFVEDVSTAYANRGGRGRVLDEETGRRIEQRMLTAMHAMPEPPKNISTSAVKERSGTSPVIEQHVSAARDVYLAGRDQIFDHSMHMSNADLLRARADTSLAAFAVAMREFAGQCPVALVIDDLHYILGTGAGRWLLGVLDQLPGVLIVHARRTEAAHRVLGHAIAVSLTAMSQEETEAYALHRLPGWAPGEAGELGSLIFSMTGGQPVWVGACCQMIATETAPGEPASRVRERLLGGAPTLSDDERMARFGAFVDDYCAGLLGAAVPVFDLLTVLRRVSRAHLTSLFAEDGLPELAVHRLDERACGRLFAWLTGSSFMTAFDDTALGDDGEPVIRLHDVIRHEAERQLRLGDLTWYRKLHAAAERYYRTTMNFDQEPEEGVSPHQYGTRYEKLTWRTDSREWLHHAGQVDDRAFNRVMQAMVRLFLDAFWWYESDFPLEEDYHYSKTLLADYRALPRRQSGELWLRHLEDFQENYVADAPNREPGRDSERWERTQDALRGLWTYLQLDRATIPDRHDLRRIQILLSVWRGDAEYYGGNGDEPSRQRAATWYAEAEQAASLDEDDQWIGNWALYLRADLYVQTDPSRARELARALPELIDEQKDHELRVYLIWLYGDLAWEADDKQLAFDIYARAVLHAFVFHLRQERLPQNPSPYTDAFYQMFMDWTRQRLDEAGEEGLGELANTAVSRMNMLFAPYWQRVGRRPDNPEGFPSQPEPDDLGTINTSFAKTVIWTLDAMQDRLKEPMDSPLLLA